MSKVDETPTPPVKQTIAKFEGTPVRTNAALVFIKPHAVNGKVQDLVKSALTAAKVRVVGEGQLDAHKIEADGIFDRHWATFARYATDWTPERLALSEEAKLDFTAKAKAANDSGAAANAVEDEAAAFIINGFYLVNREKFTAPGSIVHWYSVEWNEADLTWADFRGKLIGPTNPEQAPADSIRGKIFQDWQALGLATAPNVSDNGVHASAGPLEGLAERIVWLGAKLEDDPFAKAAIAAEATAAALQDLIQNPVVNLDDKIMPAFDILEDRQTSDAIALVVQHTLQAAAAVKIQAIERQRKAKAEVAKMRQEAKAKEDAKRQEEAAKSNDTNGNNNNNSAPAPEPSNEIVAYEEMEEEEYKPYTPPRTYVSRTRKRFDDARGQAIEIMGGNPTMDQKQLKHFFELFDVDGSGRIDRKEFFNLYMSFEHFGAQPSEKRLKALFDRYDTRRDGTLDFEEYSLLMIHRFSM